VPEEAGGEAETLIVMMQAGSRKTEEDAGCAEKTNVKRETIDVGKRRASV
jgi:hypothetical protein